MNGKKTWMDKFSQPREPKVKKIEIDFAGIPANSKMLIATPAIIDAYIRSIPSGKFVSIEKMRKDLAADYNAEYSCPVTTGIFTRIVAEAAFEKYSQTNSWRGVTPFWRIVDPVSALAAKLTFGIAVVVQQQKKEKILFDAHVHTRTLRK